MWWRSDPRGTPQGGPLSPLLANLLLDEVDKELERRGHRFCRYTDDLNAVAHVRERKFLGYRLLASGRLTIAPQSLARAKEIRIREITRRNRGIRLERMISELNRFLSGWVTCFRYASAKGHLERMDKWIRRRLAYSDDADHQFRQADHRFRSKPITL